MRRLLPSSVCPLFLTLFLPLVFVAIDFCSMSVALAGAPGNPIILGASLEVKAAHLSSAHATRTIKSVEEILSLSEHAVKRNPRVDIQGVVVHIDRDFDTYTIQEGEATVFAICRKVDAGIAVGSSVQLKGTLLDGYKNRYIEGESIELAEHTSPPIAIKEITSDDSSSLEDRKLISVTGVIERIKPIGNNYHAWLRAGRREYKVRIPFTELASANLQEYSRVHLVGLWTDAHYYLEEAKYEGGKPALFVNTIEVLGDGLPETQGRSSERVSLKKLHEVVVDRNGELFRSQGIVNCIVNDSVWVGDQEAGLELRLSNLSVGVKVDDRVEFEGRLANDNGRAVLEAVYILASGDVDVDSIDSPTIEVRGRIKDPMVIGRRVQLEGEFLHRIEFSTYDVLAFRSYNDYVYVHCSFDEDRRFMSSSRAGARFRIQGVPILEKSEKQLNSQLRIYVDDNNQLTQISLAPWPMEATLAIVSVLSSGLAIGLVGLGLSQYRMRRALNKVENIRSEIKLLNQELEERIVLRTAELERANANLNTEMNRRQKADEKLALQQAELLHVARLSTLGLMSTAISHEINQPLVAISNYASACTHLLESGSNVDDANLRKFVAEIAQQSVRAGHIVRRMRSFGRKTGEKRSTCQLNGLIVDSIELVAMEYQQRSIQIRLELSEPSPLVIADRVQIQQVVVNLLSNASDALLDVDSSNRIVFMRSRVEGEFAVLEIEDNGPGIPADVIDRLFNPFVTSKSHGMGIGLSICDIIAKEHGGEVFGVNLPTGGARFQLVLPSHASQRIDAGHPPSDP